MDRLPDIESRQEQPMLAIFPRRALLLGRNDLFGPFFSAFIETQTSKEAQPNIG
jgi:hypothetical protein